MDGALTHRTGFFAEEPAKGFTGSTWDAKHMSAFLNTSNYSNWSNRQLSDQSSFNRTHHRSYSTTHGDYFFRTTKEDKNVSKIGCTPIFPLVTNS